MWILILLFIAWIYIAGPWGMIAMIAVTIAITTWAA